MGLRVLVMQRDSYLGFSFTFSKLCTLTMAVCESFTIEKISGIVTIHIVDPTKAGISHPYFIILIKYVGAG